MFLIFDTETTGLPLNFSAPLSDSDNWPRMVQLAWQLHDEQGNLIENQDYIIRPEGYDIPFNAARIHGITTKKAMEEGKELAWVLEEFNKVLTRTKVGVGHNVDFDYNIIGAEFYRKQMANTLQETPKADTMELGTDFCALPGRGSRFKSPKLGELFEKLYGYQFEEAHNAAADVNATAQVFFEMARKGIVPAEKILWTDEQFQQFQRIWTAPVQPFDIEVRRQVAGIQKKKVAVDFGDNDELEIGDYFNFHNHTIYSTLSSTSQFSDLINTASENGFKAVGMVDLGNLMGAFKFVSEVEKYNDDLQNKKKVAEEKGEPFFESELLPVLGCEFYVSERPEQKQFTKDDPDRRTHTVLLAKNFEGYRNLAKLSSLGYTQGYYAGVPRISRKQIAQYKENLIAVTAGIYGDVPNAILNYGEQKGEEIFLWWKEQFEADFYVQIQEHGIEEEEPLNEVLLSLADKHDVKILAQNETFYTRKEDAKIQDILICIKDGERFVTPKGKGYGKRKGLLNDKYHIQSPAELKKTFRKYPDAFEAYTELLEKIEPYTLKREVLLPKFDIPEEFLTSEDDADGGKRGENAYLRHLAYEGAKKKYGDITDEIQERLDFELEVIANTGYPGYFLIVQDFCNEARRMGVSVGPGRGSAAGSAVAYCIGITNVDPIKYDLLFERFLNPERVSMPDIDIDFDDEGRDAVIKWVIDKYGKTNVAQIITYSVLGGKSAIKDAGRVLDVSIPDTNAIAKLIPESPGMNISKALNKPEKLRPEDRPLAEEMKQILANPSDPRYQVLSSAQKMEGCIRNTGIHACGVIITPEDISNLVPISISQKDADILVSQFDNSVAENAGLLKMDFLGLRTLTIIKDAIKLINQRHGIEIDTDTLALDDKKTYELFKEGRTIGIFQYESPGMQKYMRELKPTVFADLIAMNALYRPGPIKYIPNFINRKHGLEEIVYDLPETEEYLKETYGITVYQEQVMLLSQKLANFTKGEADTLRKAMGKKQKNVLDKMYPKFIEGGKNNNLDEEKLNKIWKDWEAFAEYAFNKSHSTCYALIAYHTAYLKANFPAEYMASVMSNNINNTKQITLFMEDCKAMGVDVLGPDVNESQYAFAVNEKGQIRFGLGAIKGIGEAPSEAIYQERQNGRFKNVFDFFERIPSNQINKRVVESLVIAGAFDELDVYHRAQYFDVDNAGRTTIEKLLRYGQSFQDSKNSVENSLFADFAEEVKIETPRILPCAEWQNMHKLNREKEIIGFYLSAHPLDEYKFQYKFVNGEFSKSFVLDDRKNEDFSVTENSAAVLLDADLDEDALNLPLDATEEDELVEYNLKRAEPKGGLNFLNLDEIDVFKDQVFPAGSLFNQPKDWKERKRALENAKEYSVSGLITAIVIRDGKNSGEKVCFITLEDYTGNYSFRLGDKDYMKLRDKIAQDRFVILKLKYSQGNEGRIYINVTDIMDLKDAFDKYAKSLSLVIPIHELNKADLEFFKTQLMAEKGEHKLNVYLKNPLDESFLEIRALQQKVNISTQLLQKLHEFGKFEIYLN